MSIPNDIYLPKYKNGDDLQNYMERFRRELEEVYKNLADSSNGHTKYSTANSQYDNWTPTIYGASASGAGTYTTQAGWVVRQGLMVDLFFQVAWSAHTGTGNMYVELPYKPAASLLSTTTYPFIGAATSSGITYPAGLDFMVCVAVPNTYRLEFFLSGTTMSSATLTVQTSGELRGSIRYIGQADE